MQKKSINGNTASVRVNIRRDKIKRRLTRVFAGYKAVHYTVIILFAAIGKGEAISSTIGIEVVVSFEIYRNFNHTVSLVAQAEV